MKAAPTELLLKGLDHSPFKSMEKLPKVNGSFSTDLNWAGSSPKHGSPLKNDFV